MKAWEAMKLLEEGKKLRDKNWKEGRYIYLDVDGDIIDESNNQYLVANISDISKEWEIYNEKEEDSRKEVEDKKLKQVCNEIIEYVNISNYYTDRELRIISDMLYDISLMIEETNKKYKLDK